MTDSSRLSADERFNILLDHMAGDRFLHAAENALQTLPLPPAEAASLPAALAGALAIRGIRAEVLDLFDFSMGILEARGYLEKLLKSEPTLPKRKIADMLWNVLSPEKTLGPALCDSIRQSGAHAVFLSNLGALHPFASLHGLHNALREAVLHLPTVLFFPGILPEEGCSPELFGSVPCQAFHRVRNIWNLIG